MNDPKTSREAARDPLGDADEMLAAKVDALVVARPMATLKVAAWIVARHRLRRALRREPSPAEVRQHADTLARRSDIDLRGEAAAIPEEEVRRDLATDADLRRLAADAGLPGLRETHGLTPREREALRIYGETHSIKETAHRMQIEIPTVKAHLRGARLKTDARDSWDAVDKDNPEG